MEKNGNILNIFHNRMKYEERKKVNDKLDINIYNINHRSLTNKEHLKKLRNINNSRGNWARIWKNKANPEYKNSIGQMTQCSQQINYRKKKSRKELLPIKEG